MSGKRMAVYGRSGSGKSEYTKHMIRGLPRVVVFDPEEEYGVLPGFTSLDDLGDVVDLLHDCWDTSYRVSYVPGAGNEIAELHALSLIIERVGEAFKLGHTSQPLMFVVDELHLSYPLTVNTVKYDGFARIVRRGRKRGINLIGTTQRPAEVNTSFRGNIDRVAVFALAQQIDKDAAAKATGDQLLPLLAGCPQYGHVFYENGEFRAVDPIPLP